jgi:hypothetical protein
MRNIFRQLLACATRLGAIGLVTVGASGAVAALLGTVAGKAFVSGDPRGVTYTVARCAEFHEYAPGARTCEQAATVHHFGEVIGYRLAAGVLGLFVVAVLVVARRRYAHLLDQDCLPVAFEDTVGATLFGAAAVALLGSGLDQIALGNDGAGFWLSAGIVAATAATAFAMRWFRRLVAVNGAGTR